jgi:transposase-like protein
MSEDIYEWVNRHQVANQVANQPPEAGLDAAAVEHHKKVNPYLANDPYYQVPEHNQTIEAFHAGAAWQSQRQAKRIEALEAALELAVEALEKDYRIHGSTYAANALERLRELTQREPGTDSGGE